MASALLAHCSVSALWACEMTPGAACRMCRSANGPRAGMHRVAEGAAVKFGVGRTAYYRNAAGRVESCPPRWGTSLWKTGGEHTARVAGPVSADTATETGGVTARAAPVGRGFFRPSWPQASKPVPSGASGARSSGWEPCPVPRGTQRPTSRRARRCRRAAIRPFSSGASSASHAA